jgi:hypothetical protein
MINSIDTGTNIPAPVSDFLSTAYRIKTDNPMGLLTYLDMVNVPTVNKSEWGDLSDDSDMSTLSLSVFSKTVQVESFRKDSKRAIEFDKDLKEYGINPSHQTFSSLNEQMFIGYEKRLFDMYLNSGRVAKENEREKYSTWKKLMIRIGFSDSYYTENLTRTVQLLSGSVALRNRRGPADFVIVSKKFLLELEDSKEFVFRINETITNGPKYQYMGYIGNIKVFCDEGSMDWDNNEIILGRSTRESTDVGTFIVDYQMNFSEFETESDIHSNLTSRHAIVQTGLDPHVNYYATRIIIGAKPWYRKLLGI